jgi:hypothetical protein
MKSIKNIIEQIIVDNNLENEFLFARINEVWKNKLSYYADNIHISKYKNKIIYMQTDSPAWRKEIIIKTDDIINQLNSNLKEHLITKIII